MAVRPGQYRVAFLESHRISRLRGARVFGDNEACPAVLCHLVDDVSVGIGVAEHPPAPVQVHHTGQSTAESAGPDPPEPGQSARPDRAGEEFGVGVSDGGATSLSFPQRCATVVRAELLQGRRGRHGGQQFGDRGVQHHLVRCLVRRVASASHLLLRSGPAHGVNGVLARLCRLLNGMIR